MYQTLVVPLDGSELAERALPYAVQLAEAGQGRLVVVRVALAPLPAQLDGFGWEQAELDALHEAEQYLARVAETLRPRVAVETVVSYGRATEQLIEVVDDVEADAVVMATHGRTGPAHLLHGSIAEAMLASSPVPVLLVRAHPGDSAPAPFDPQAARLIVPLDGSAFAEAAIPPALKLLGAAGELVLVLVAEPPDHVLEDDDGRVLAYLDQQVEARELAATAVLMGVVQRLHQQHPGVRVSTEVRFGQPAEGIVASALAYAADLVVMATHGRTGLRRAVLGSVAGEVLRTGHTPVLLVHPRMATNQPTEAASPAVSTPWIVA